jgi:flagellar hook-length control protein FliK
MVITGSFPAGEIATEAAVDGASINQGGDFSGLLLLVLAAAAPQSAPFTGVSGLPVATNSNENNGSDKVNSFGIGEIVDSDGPMASSSVQENYGNSNVLSEAHERKSKTSAFLSDTHHWEGIRLQTQAEHYITADIERSWDEAGEEDASTPGPEGLCDQSENPLIEADTFDGTTAPSNGLRDVVSREIRSTSGAVIEPVVAKLHLNPISTGVVGINIAANAGHTQNDPETESHQRNTVFCGYSNGVSGILDRKMAGSGREPVNVDEPDGNGSSSICDRGNLHPAVLSGFADHNTPGHDKPQLMRQSRYFSEVDLDGRMLPRLIQDIDAIRSFDGQQTEQEFCFQHDDPKLSDKPLELAVEPAFQALSGDNVPFHIAETKDKTPATAPRVPQVTDWHPVISRLAGEIGGRIRLGKEQATLQLDPPELGKLRIDLHLDGDKVAARILTESQESQLLLETHLPELRQALGENRVQLLDVRIDSGSWTGWHGDSQHGSHRESNGGRQPVHEFNSAFSGSKDEGEPPGRSVTVHSSGAVSMWA